jgi:hypothetical protein
MEPRHTTLIPNVFGIRIKQILVVSTPMNWENGRLRIGAGIALIVLAGTLLFALPALGASAHELGAIAVLGLAGGAVLIGTSEDGRPV